MMVVTEEENKSSKEVIKSKKQRTPQPLAILKKSTLICCGFSCIIPLILLIIVLLTSHRSYSTTAPTYPFAEIVGYTVKNGVVSPKGLPNPIINSMKLEEHEATTTLALHPVLSNMSGNMSRNMCTHPFERACETKEKSLQNLIDENNIRTILKVVRETLRNSNFVVQCRNFQGQQHHEEKLKQLLNHKSFQVLLNHIPDIEKLFGEEESVSVGGNPSSSDTIYIKNPSKWYDRLALLQSFGIREPFHLNLLPNEKLQLNQPHQLAVISARKYVGDFLETLVQTHFKSKKSTLKDTILNDYEKVFNHIFVTETSAVWARERVLSLREIREKTGFQIEHYIKYRNLILQRQAQTNNKKNGGGGGGGVEPNPPFSVIDLNTRVLVDVYSLEKFHHAITGVFTKKTLQHYLIVATLKSIMYQTHTLLNENERGCDKQLVKYFPIHICREFKKIVGVNEKELGKIKEYAKSRFERVIFENNLFGLQHSVLSTIRNKWESMEWVINRCVSPQTNNTLTALESRYLNQVERGETYLDIMFSLIHESDFQERRNTKYEGLYDKSVESNLEWNARYIKATNQLIIPPGLLDFLFKFTKPGSCLFESLLYPPIFHETGHFFSMHMDDFSRLFWSVSYSKFDKNIRSRYNSPVNSNHDENIADNFGIDLAFNGWVEKPSGKTIEGQKCFILTYIRQWCKVVVEINAQEPDPHALPKQRAINPLWTIRNGFKSAFNCTE